MLEHVVRNLGGIGLYGLVSLLLFLGVFLGVLVWAFRLRRSDLEAAARLPLEETSEDPFCREEQP